MEVIVVTDTELGWDCVVGVFASIEAYNDYCETDYGSWDEAEAIEDSRVFSQVTIQK